MLVFGRVIFPKKNIMPRFKVGKSSYSAGLVEKNRYKQTILCGWQQLPTRCDDCHKFNEFECTPKSQSGNHLSFGWILEPEKKKTSKKTILCRRSLFVWYIFGPGLSYIFSISVAVLSGIPSEVLLASKTLHNFWPDENFIEFSFHSIEPDNIKIPDPYLVGCFNPFEKY